MDSNKQTLPASGEVSMTMPASDSNQESDESKNQSTMTSSDQSQNAQQGGSNTAGIFHVDTSRIRSATLSEEASELNKLGLNVFNQDEFEQDIMAQVDEAMANKEKQRLERIVEKELKSVNEEIRTTKQELENTLRAFRQLLGQSNTDRNSKETQCKIDAMKRHKENKMNQLKKLQAKQKSLSLKSGQSADSGEQSTASLEMALGIGESTEENEMERMIRTGEMTPFGTVVQSQGLTTAPPVKESAKPSTSQVSDFEMFLLGQDKKKLQKAKLVKSASASCPSNSLTEKPSNSKSHDKTPRLKKSSSDGESSSFTRKKSAQRLQELKNQTNANFFDKKSKRTYRPSEKDFSDVRVKKKKQFSSLSHNFSEDGDLSDIDNGDDYDDGDGICADEDDEEYVPDDEELRGSWNDGDEEMKTNNVKSKDEEEDELIRKRMKANLKKAGKGQMTKKRKHSSDEDYVQQSDSDDDSFSVNKIKNKYRKQRRPTMSVHSRDDGNLKSFKSRIKKLKLERLMNKQERRDRGEDSSDSESYVEFDGGLQVPGRIWAKLHGYQRTCVRWLWELHVQQTGGIVGDEMGLGKTIQMIAFLASLHHSKLRNRGFKYVGLGPVLIVCPATVMHQWVREFHKWWPDLRVAILHSSGSYSGKEVLLVDEICKTSGVLVTSYTTVTLQQDALLPYDWHYVVLDEGHKIRNPDAQVTLVCKQLRTPHRLILSGSPMQNNLKELWSLFDFIFPGKLGTLPDFMAHFSVPIVQGGYANASQTQVQAAYKCACILRDTINPYLLRRMKADVKDNINLPSKSEQVLFCRLTEDQIDVYQEYLQSKECSMILSGNFMVFPGLITLRKICNHPDLATGGPRVFFEDEVKENKTLEYGYYERSGKMIVVESLMKLWKTQGHRVLLFTQSKQMLDILESFVQNKGYTYMRMDGATSISARQPLITKYNQDPSIFTFLLTTRVGGLGVNLTGANRIIIFDPDWNPSTDMQARERAWRIGQTRDVTIYRLLTTGTIEEKIYHRQIFKQFLTNRVLKDPKQRRFFKSNDLFELFQLNIPENKEKTETSAIFAGTNCDIPIIPVSKKVNANKGEGQAQKKNRFDRIKEESLNHMKEDSDEEESLQKMIGDDKVLKMKELAKKLSQKIGQNDSSETVNGASTKPQNEKPRSGSDGKRISKASKLDYKMLIKEKKKKKDAKFEGKRIAYLQKQAAFKYPSESEKEKSAQEDDYVLAKLFKKSGVHSAMQHDKIMQSSHPDHAIVEAEAERVALEAVNALKQSRTQCFRATSGVPTWTGHHGGAQQAAARPRFGQKKNSKLLPNLNSQKASSTSTTSSTVVKNNDSKTKAKHFDGSLSGTAKTTNGEASSGNSLMSSAELMSLMKSRNYVKGDDAVSSSPPGVSIAACSADDTELLTDIRNYIAFGCTVDGEARTQELLDQFRDRLPVEHTAKFKAMLHQICDLQKSSGVGVWRLKPEFR